MHAEFDRLWALTHDELPPAEAAELRDHLAACPDCAAKLADLEAAQPLFAAPPVPQLDEARWARIDARVMAAAAEEMSRPGLWASLRALWGSPFLKPALALGGLAAVVALVVVLGGQPAPVPVAVIPEPDLAAQDEAVVVASIDTSTGGADLAPAAPLKTGSVLTTRAEGEAWLKLPDGSRLGVLAASQARLAQLSPKAVRVELDQGSVAVSAVHEPDRSLEVVAGRLTLRVVGTRFLVMRDGQTSGVAVQEGLVEAAYDDKVVPVPAGATLSLSNGSVELARLDEPQQQQIQQLVPPRPAPQPKRPVRPVLPAAVDAGPVAAAPAEVPVVIGPAAGEDAGEWAALPPQDASADQWAPLPPPPAPEPVVVAPASAPDAGRRNWLQEQLAKLSEGRIPPFDVTPDQIPAKLKEMAEKGHCDRVLHETEEMLRKWPDAGMTPRRQRLLNKILEERDRCVRRWNEQR